MSDKELKWKSECLAKGLKYLGKPKDRNYSTCECQLCGHVDDYQQVNIRAGKVSCSNCNDIKWKAECLAQGLKWISKKNARHSTCECTTCGHVDDYRQDSIRAGEVSCSNCNELRWKSECLAQGLKWLSKKNAKYSTCECTTCGHIDDYRQSHIRAGAVACSNCSPGHWNEPANFYVVRISLGYESMIKIGIANNPARRYKQYGLPSNAFIEQLLTIPFDTKLDAIKYESKMKQLLEPYRIDPDVAKVVLSYSGFTECYDERSLDILI